MASHTRYILKYGGGYYNGAQALKFLARTGEPLTTLKDKLAAAGLIKATLWVFREPRRAKFAHSRYLKLCRYLGMGRRKNKIQFHAPIPAKPGGNHHGGVNQGGGLAAQAQGIAGWAVAPFQDEGPIAFVNYGNGFPGQ